MRRFGFMKKKLLSILLSAAMVFSMGMPSLSAKAADTGQTTQADTAASGSKLEKAKRYEMENTTAYPGVSFSDGAWFQVSDNFSNGAARNHQNYRKGDSIKISEFDYQPEKEGDYLLTIAYAIAQPNETHKNEPKICVQKGLNDPWIVLDAPVTGAIDKVNEISMVVHMTADEEYRFSVSGIRTDDTESECSELYEGCVDYVDIARIITDDSDSSSERKEVLDDLGFQRNEDSYKTNQINDGNHQLSSKAQILYETYNGTNNHQTSVGCKESELDTDFNSIESENSGEYKLTTTFDPTGTGKKEYVARLSLENGSKGGSIRLTVENLKTRYYRFWNQDTGGYIDGADTTLNKNAGIDKQQILGLMNVVAGDFDGDGADELAVYAPNNKVEDSDGTPAKEEIKIYDIDMDDIYAKELPEPTQVIDISAGMKNWGNTKIRDEKSYYGLPYLSMAAEDVNGDGIDDLLTVANFGSWHSTVSNGCNGYTWNEVLDPDSCFASVLDVYEGKKDGGFKQSVKKRPLIAKTEDTGGYVLRNATAIVANVSEANSKEIVLSGNYTSINYDSETTTTTKVAYGRDVSLFSVGNGGKYGAGNIYSANLVVGYTDYGTLTRNTTSASSLKYTWSTAYGHTYLSYTNQYYNLQGKTNYVLAAEPVAAAGFAAFGSSQADTIFVEGQFFTCDSDGKLTMMMQNLLGSQSALIGSTLKAKYRGNVWITSAVVANTTDSEIGAETLHLTFSREYASGNTSSSASNPQYAYTDICIGGQIENATTSYTTTRNLISTQRSSVNLVNLEDDNSIISFQSGDTDIYYGDVEVYSVLQAAPTWKELDDGTYLDHSSTSYTKSHGSSSSTGTSTSVSAGVVMGFEHETSLLGLFSVGGMDFETTVSASVGYDSEKTVSKEFSTEYNTIGSEDVAVLFTVPYVRYNCKMYLPSYTLPKKAEYEAKLAFQKELEQNLVDYVDKGVKVVGGTYSKPTDAYNKQYTTDVTSENYSDQVALNNNYVEWLEMMESTIKELGGGGIYHWGTYMTGGWQNYYYSIPQTPILTTVDVSTYDEIASATSGLEPIYGNLFDENYVTGDPSTYARSTSQLKVENGGSVLSGETNVGSNSDTNGFITSSAISASGSSPSQTITVSKEDAKTVTYGASVETSLIAKVGSVKAGAAFSFEKENSNCWTTTEGNEYTGTVANLPKGTSSDYNYGWKMVAYQATLNGKSVPVVGYLTRITQNPPPSVPEDLAVVGITSRSVTLQWSAGNRLADTYVVYRVRDTNKGWTYTKIGSVSEAVNGTYNFTDDNSGKGLSGDTKYYYAVKAVSNLGKESVYSKMVSARTFAADVDLQVALTGINSNEVYFGGQDIPLKVNVKAGEGTEYSVKSYEWQYNTGNGWKKIKGSKDQDTYMLRTSTLKNGYQYRCKVDIQIGDDLDGDSYDWYTNTLTQQAKRVGTTVNLVNANEQQDITNIQYVCENDKVAVAAQVASQMDSKDTIDGKVTFLVDYYGSDPEQTTPESTTSYEVTLDADGAANSKVTLPEFGYYKIRVSYGGNQAFEGSDSEQTVNCQVYKNNEHYFDAQKVTLDDQYYYEVIGGANNEKYSREYTGEQICPTVRVGYSWETFTEGTDYKVVYGENTEAGEDAGSVSIVPIGDYELQKPIVIKFDIWKNFDQAEASFADGEVFLDTEDQPYTVLASETDKDTEKETEKADGEEETKVSEPKVTLTHMGQTMTEGKDYTVAYSDNTKAGQKATVTITGIGNFKGTEKTLSFAIKERATLDLSRFTDKEADAAYVNSYKKVASYDPKTNTMTILPSDDVLELTGTNEDLTIRTEGEVSQMIWKDVVIKRLDLPDQKGDIEIILDGKNQIISTEKDVPAVSVGNEKDDPLSLTFTEKEKKDSDETEKEKASLIISGGENASAISNVNGRVVLKDAEFELNAGEGKENAVEADSIVVKDAQTKSNVEDIYSVKPLDGNVSFANAEIRIADGKDSYTYTGSAIKPEIQVTLDGITLKKDMDYTEIGEKTGSITVTPKDIFESGEARTIYFSITKPATPVKPDPVDPTPTPTPDPVDPTPTPNPVKPTPSKPKTVKVTKVVISGDSKKIAAGKKLKLTAYVTPKNATNKAVTWTTSNKKYATVSASGVVTTKKAGAGKSVTITATAKDGSKKKATYKISLVKHVVKGIKITTKAKTVKPGKSLTLKTKVTTSGKTANTALAWSSSNTKYATVSGKGVVKAAKNAKGKSVKITARALDGSGKKVTVTIKIK